MKPFLRTLLVITAHCFLGGCGPPLTDGATRLAGDLGCAAKKLHRDTTQSSLEVEHHPVAIPDGIKGRYEVVFQASLDHPRAGGSLLVGDLDSPNYQKWGYNWSTTSHLNHVRVPNELRIQKNAGDSLVVVLERRKDGLIDVTKLK